MRGIHPWRFIRYWFRRLRCRLFGHWVVDHNMGRLDRQGFRWYCVSCGRRGV